MKKYIRFSQFDNVFFYCVVDDKNRRYNKDYGEIAESDIPPEKATEAKNRAGTWPSWVQL